jgi:tetratricopeptide (TPR) repeat protein
VQENLPQVVDAVPADSEDVFFLLMSARACSSLLRFDEAIVRGERALELDDESADARLILAEALQFRAVNRGTNSQRADLVRSVDLSIEARNLRRTWMVPSGDAAAVACQGCSMLNDSAKVLQLGRKEPDGEATEEESTNARTLVQVASAALQQAKIGVAQEALAELPDGFERMLLSGQILRATDNTEAALTALNNAYGIADDAPSKRQAQFQLALMGANPLPDQEDLEAVDTAETALLLATAEAARGESASAIARLRAWRSKSLECAIVLASVLASKGNHADAAEILSDVARRFNEPGSLVEAAKLLLAANDQEGAKARAEEALISLIENSVARRTALLILLKIAEAQQDWTRVERHARSLILDDPSSNEAHWSLVAALFNANLYDQAWAALVSADLKPENESEARAWMALATRNSNDPKLVDEILDLADVYESEEFGAAAIGAILQVPVDEDWPEARVTRFQNLTSEYVDRFPNGRYLQQLTFESPEDLVGILRDRLEPGAQEHLKLRRDVAQFRMPYVLLASSAGRPYAEAFLQRAAGCLTVSIGDAATLTKEIEDATAALDGTVVIDAASLVVLSYIPGTWSPIRGAFHSIRILEPSRADILQSRDQIVAMGVDSMGWNPVADAPVLHTVAPEVLAELRERATWVADRAIELDPITFSALNDESRSTDQRVLAAFGPLDYAQSHGIPLFSDDAFLRAHAWQSGVPTFGTAALLYALAGREAIATEEVNPLLQDLRRGYCVDLPPDSQQIIALAEEDHWRAGPGLFVFTRASLWRDTVSTMALFRACATRAFSEDKDLLAVWLAAGIQGLGSLTPPEHLPVAVAQLLLTVLTIPGSDPEQFAKLAQVARDMTKAFGAADPTEGMLRSFLDAAITSLGAEMGTRTFLALTDRFAGDDRDIVRRLAFGV